MSAMADDIDVTNYSQKQTCYAHINNSVRDIHVRHFNETTWATFLKCVNIWKDLEGNVPEIARGFVKSHDGNIENLTLTTAVVIDNVISILLIPLSRDELYLLNRNEQLLRQQQVSKTFEELLGCYDSVSKTCINAMRDKDILTCLMKLLFFLHQVTLGFTSKPTPIQQNIISIGWFLNSISISQIITCMFHNMTSNLKGKVVMKQVNSYPSYSIFLPPLSLFHFFFKY